jgi:hypothetical protein
MSLSDLRAERLRECGRELGFSKLRLAAARGRHAIMRDGNSRARLVRAQADVYIWEARVGVLQS